MSDRNAIKHAYGLLWHFNSDGTPNSKIVTEARKTLRDVLVRDELSEGIQSAEETCRRAGAKFDPTIGGGWVPT